MIRYKPGRVKVIIMDVDGVLTDGTISFGNFNDDYRGFNARDGLGLKVWGKAGYHSAVITAKSSRAVKRRCRELGIDLLYQGVEDKLRVFNKALLRLKVTPEEVCYIGDDLPDLPVLRAAGMAVTVPEAPEELRNVADYTTVSAGGRGAVRETVEFILRAQEKWESLIKVYTG